MTAYLTDKDSATAITVPFGLDVAEPVSDNMIGYLAYLGYKGPEPETAQAATALIAELLGVDLDEENAKTHQEYDEDIGDGRTITEDQYARMVRLRRKGEQD